MRQVGNAFWLQTLPSWILGPLTIALIITGSIPLHYLLLTFVMWVFVCGLGVAVGYHRVFSHRTHTLPTWKENVILALATFAGQGASIFWVAVHRGYHHPHADTTRDIHSPVVWGLWHAFAGWYMQIVKSNNSVNLKYAVDLIRKPNHMWFHKHHHKVLWGVPAIVALFNWQVALTAFCLVTFIGVMQDNAVNVFGHTKAFVGYRNYDTNDNSYNNFFLGYFGWGQGWHNNHHAFPKKYNFGTKWWEWDPTTIFLPLLGRPN